MSRGTTVPDTGFALCYACKGSGLCQVCGGTTIDPDGRGLCTACDHGSCDTCDGTGQVREAFVPDDNRAIIFEQGHATAADAPWGYERVRLTQTGDLEYEQRAGEQRRVIQGHVHPGRVASVFTSLEATRFPERPQARFEPGASITTITVDPPGNRVLVDYFDGMQMKGYREVIRDLSELNNALREDKKDTLASWHFEPRSGADAS